jgi:hypothetical protein
MTSTWEVAASLGVIEASVVIVGKDSLDKTREVAVGWTSPSSIEEGMIVPMLEASIEEADRLGKSSVEVVPSKTVMLLDKSSTAGVLEITASVVIGDKTISLGTAVLETIVSISVMSTLVETIEDGWSSSVSVGDGNKVGDATSSETEVMMAGSAVATSEPSRILVVLPITSVRLSSTTDEVVAAGKATSVGVVKASGVVLGAIVPVSVGSSCIGGADGDSGKLEGADRSILAAEMEALSALPVTDTEDGLKTLGVSSEPVPTPKLIDTLAVGMTSVTVSDNVRDGGSTKSELSLASVAVTPGTFTSLDMVDSGTSSVIAGVLVSGVERVGRISTSAELGKDCFGSTSSETVGSGSSVIEVDVVSPDIWGGDSTSDWIVVICALSEIVLVKTSSSVEIVGASSLKAASTEVEAEEKSVLREVVMAVLSASEAVIDRSKDGEALADTSTDREGIVEVESGSSSPVVMVGSTIHVDIDVPSPTMAE